MLEEIKVVFLLSFKKVEIRIIFEFCNVKCEEVNKEKKFEECLKLLGINKDLDLIKFDL